MTIQSSVTIHCRRVGLVLRLIIVSSHCVREVRHCSLVTPAEIDRVIIVRGNLKYFFSASFSSMIPSTIVSTSSTRWYFCDTKRLYLFLFIVCANQDKTNQIMFHCPTPASDPLDDWPCIRFSDLCNGTPDCPQREDEHPIFCMFHNLV